jgi:hypothetical protein
MHHEVILNEISQKNDLLSTLQIPVRKLLHHAPNSKELKEISSFFSLE